jgi:hypothetical protein
MHKKIIIITTILFSLAAFISAQTTNTYLPGFSWRNPRIMAMGGEVSADPDGYSAFVSNPAGFVGDKTTKKVKEKNNMGEKVAVTKEVTETEFTLLAIQGAFIANPFEALRMSDQLNSGADPMAVMLDYAIGQLETNGLGLDSDLTIASYVGNGWGVGTFISADAVFPQSDLALATEGKLLMDGTFLLGYAKEFALLDFDLTVGGDIRPSFKYILPATASTLLSGMGDLTSLNATSGFGIGFDLGATLEWNDLTAALVFRDLFHTRYMMYEAPVSEFGNFSAEATAGTNYSTPMSMTIGFGYEPEIPGLNWLVKPSLVASYKTDLLLGIDPLSYYDYTQGTFFKSLHFGMETKWLNFFYLRAGMNGGYFSAGTGFDFVIGEFNLALFSEETGRTAGQNSQLGTAFELAFRW